MALYNHPSAILTLNNFIISQIMLVLSIVHGGDNVMRDPHRAHFRAPTLESGAYDIVMAGMASSRLPFIRHGS